MSLHQTFSVKKRPFNRYFVVPNEMSEQSVEYVITHVNGFERIDEAKEFFKEDLHAYILTLRVHSIRYLKR
jgi:hypothetical protein